MEKPIHIWTDHKPAANIFKNVAKKNRENDGRNSRRTE